MPFFEEMVIQESIEIKTTPEKIFKFLTGIVDNERYKIWHNTSHVNFRWIKGEPWEEDSVMYAEEYLHGKLHKLTFKVIKIVKNQIYRIYTNIYTGTNLLSKKWIQNRTKRGLLSFYCFRSHPGWMDYQILL